MKANSKHYILLILGVLTVIITSFGYWYVYNNVISQAEKRSQLTQEIKNNEQDNKQEIKLLDISSSTIAYRQKLLSYFVSDDKILDFIKSIENIANDSSTEVVLSAISAEDLIDKKVGDTGHITVHVSIKGSWANVNKALVLIENLPYNLSVKSILLDTSVSSDAMIVNTKKVSKVDIWNLSLDISALTIK